MIKASNDLIAATRVPNRTPASTGTPATFSELLGQLTLSGLLLGIGAAWLTHGDAVVFAVAGLIGGALLAAVICIVRWIVEILATLIGWLIQASALVFGVYLLAWFLAG